MGEDFRPIPVPENSVLSCGVQRDVVSSVEAAFSKQQDSEQALMSAVAQQHDGLSGDSLRDYMVFNRVTRVACARYVLGCSERIQLSTPCGRYLWIPSAF